MRVNSDPVFQASLSCLALIYSRSEDRALRKKVENELRLVNQYIPFSSLESSIKDLSSFQKLDVVNPDFEYEQELGDEIMVRKAAKQNLSLRTKQQVQKSVEQKKKDDEYLCLKSYDREGVHLNDGQVAGLFAKTNKYKYSRGSMNGPGESIVNIRFMKSSESKNSFVFRTRPYTNYETLTPGPGFYELESVESKLKDNVNSFSFQRTKRIGADGQELSSPGDMKKGEGGSKGGRAQKIRVKASLRRQGHYGFGKQDRGLYQATSGTNDMGPGYYRYADKAYQQYYDISTKFSFAREEKEIAEGNTVTLYPATVNEGAAFLTEIDDEMSKESRINKQHSNFQRFSQVQRFNEISNTEQRRSLSSRIAMSSAKLPRKQRTHSVASFVNKNKTLSPQFLSSQRQQFHLKKKSSNNIRMQLAMTTSLEIRNNKREAILHNQWMRESNYQEHRMDELCHAKREWVMFCNLVAMGQKIGDIFKSRYHTHKRCLKFLRRSYYICRFLGKAMIWLRKSRIKKAQKTLIFFVTFRVRPFLSKRVRKRKERVINFIKLFHQSSKFYISVCKLVRAIRVVQRWYKRKRLYTVFLRVMANYSWQLNEQAVIRRLQDWVLISQRKSIQKSSEVKRETCEKIIPPHIRILFMRIFMSIRMQKHYAALKLWRMECERIEHNTLKKLNSSQRLKLSQILKRGSGTQELPPKPVIPSFLRKQEICEMIRSAYMTRKIWDTPQEDPLMMRKLENFVSDNRMSLSKKRKPLVGGMGKTGKKFDQEVRIARLKYIEYKDEHPVSAQPSPFPSEQEFKMITSKQRKASKGKAKKKSKYYK